MPLQDVTNDQSMISWLRQAGHGHLIDSQNVGQQTTNSNTPSAPAAPPPLSAPPAQQAPQSFSNYPPTGRSESPPKLPSFLGGLARPTTGPNPSSASGPSSGPGANLSFGGPPNSASGSSPGPGPNTGLASIFGSGLPFSSQNRNSPSPPPMIPSVPFPNSSQPTSSFTSNPIISDHSTSNMRQEYDLHRDTLNLMGSPTHFNPINPDDPQIDMNIENMRLDPNTKVIQRPPAEDVVYKQRVFVRYLQPPTPPPGGTIIVREKQEPGPPPDPPIVIKRAPRAPPTPPPVIIRERPPPMPPAEGTTVIDKVVPAGPKPPPQLIIEQYPQLPPKPQDVIIERWLPMPQRQRKILYERLPVDQKASAPRPIIVQYGLPNIRVQREVITTPGAQPPYPQASGQANAISLNCTSVPNLNLNVQSQSNPFANTNHGDFGLSSLGFPATGSGPSKPTLFNVPESVPLDNVLRQLGVDPLSLQRSSGLLPSSSNPAMTNPWNSANYPSNNLPLQPGSQSQPWNPINNQGHQVNHDQNRPNNWNPPTAQPNPSGSNIPSFMGNLLSSGAAQPMQSHNNTQISQNYPSQNNYPPQPPQNNYPPQPSQNNYPPPPSQNNYPPPPSQNNYPPQPSQSSYPPPPSQNNYPPQPSQSSYPPPPSQNNYPPPPQGNQQPATGGAPNSGSNVLARLFGGG